MAAFVSILCKGRVLVDRQIPAVMPAMLIAMFASISASALCLQVTRLAACYNGKACYVFDSDIESSANPEE